MSRTDTPWGAEEIVLNTNISLGEEKGDIALRKLLIDAEEITPLEKHRKTNTLLYVTKGAIELEVDSNFFQLEEGDGHAIEAGKPHQIQNLDEAVTKVMQIMVPFDPDDIEILEDPYA